MPFSVAGDLLIGDMLLSTSFDKDKWVTDAYDEMNSKLGWVYSLPLRPEGVDPGDEDSWQDLPEHQQLLLKTINNRLASGRLIMAQAIGAQQQQLHAYGYSLVEQALADLMHLANRDIILLAELVDTDDDAKLLSRIPSIHNYDEESLLDGFENSVMRGVPWYTRPGQVP